MLFVKTMLAKYPLPSDWHNVCVSDEIHVGYGPNGRHWVIRKPVEAYCPACGLQKRPAAEKDLTKVHAWGCVCYRYKSKLYRYETKSPNGKMDQETYLKLIK